MPPEEGDDYLETMKVWNVWFSRGLAWALYVVGWLLSVVALFGMLVHAYLGEWNHVLDHSVLFAIGTVVAVLSRLFLAFVRGKV